MKVMILGCGPSGLVAAESMAVSDLADEIRIYSRKKKSSLYGCQYLHEPIPYITPIEGIQVDYRLEGDEAAYRRKVYGDNLPPHLTVSPEDFIGEHRAWDLRVTYDILYDRWENHITDTVITPAWLGEHMHEADLILSSIPANQLCWQGHTFVSQKIWAAGEAPWVEMPYYCPDNTVVCNGTSQVSWYRKARVFDYTTVEWPISVSKPPIPTVVRVEKPLHHNCDCWSPHVWGIGRYGRWSKEVLTHDAWKDARIASHDFLFNNRT